MPSWTTHKAKIYTAEEHAGLKILDSNLPPLMGRSYCLDKPHEVATASAATQVLADNASDLHHANSHHGLNNLYSKMTENHVTKINPLYYRTQTVQP